MAKKPTGQSTTKAAPPPMPLAPPSDSVEAASIEVGADVEPSEPTPQPEVRFAGSAEQEEQRAEQAYKAERDGSLDKLLDEMESMKAVIARQTEQIKGLRAGDLTMPSDGAMTEYIAAKRREFQKAFARSRTGKIRIMIETRDDDVNQVRTIPVIVNDSVRRLVPNRVIEVGPSEIESLLHAEKDSQNQPVVGPDGNPVHTRVHQLRYQITAVGDDSQ